MSWIPPDTNVQPGTHATKDSDPPDAEDEKKARQREVMAHGVSPLHAVQEKMPGAEDSIQVVHLRRPPTRGSWCLCL